MTGDLVILARGEIRIAMPGSHARPVPIACWVARSCSPIPPVSTSRSSPPSVAAIAAICLQTDRSNIRIARSALGLLPAAARSTRMSPDNPEIPAIPES